MIDRGICKFSVGSLPSWECGLKLYLQADGYFMDAVTPFVGVWIEIVYNGATLVEKVVTPFVGVWIEITAYVEVLHEYQSHSLRGSVD